MPQSPMGPKDAHPGRCVTHSSRNAHQAITGGGCMRCMTCGWAARPPSRAERSLACRSRHGAHRMTSKTRREVRCHVLSAPKRWVQKWSDCEGLVDQGAESVDKRPVTWTRDPSCGDRPVGESARTRPRTPPSLRPPATIHHGIPAPSSPRSRPSTARTRSSTADRRTNVRAHPPYPRRDDGDDECQDRSLIPPEDPRASAERHARPGDNPT